MSKTTPEEAVELITKYELFRHDGKFIERIAALIDELRGVDAEPVGTVTITKGVGVFEKIQFQLIRGLSAGTHQIYTHPAPTIKDSLSVQSPPIAEWPECKKCGGNLWQCMACHPTAAPVELPVVGYASPNNLYRSRQTGISNGEQILEPLVKLSDAQAAIAAGRKAS